MWPGEGEQVPQGLGEAHGPRFRACTPPPGRCEGGARVLQVHRPFPSPRLGLAPGAHLPTALPPCRHVCAFVIGTRTSVPVEFMMENMYRRETQRDR